MKTLYFFFLCFLLMLINTQAKADLSPSASVGICPGSRVTYTIQGAFTNRNVTLTITGGKFTANNSTTIVALNRVEVEWNQNIQSGSISVKDEGNGNSQTYNYNLIPITAAYAADNISVQCGITGNITFEVKIVKVGTSGGPAQGEIIGSQNFVDLPSGVTYVSFSPLPEGSEFGVTFLRYQVTLSINATANGQASFRSAYRCGPLTSSPILSTELKSFQIVRTLPAISFSSTPPQTNGFAVFCSPGEGANYSINTNGAPSQLTWTVESGNLLINGSNVFTSSSTNQAYISANGSGTFKVTATSTGCSSAQPAPIYGKVYVGAPQISDVTIDNVINPGPYPVNSGSTHYVNTQSTFNYIPNYSFSTQTNSGDISLNLSGINFGNCQVNVSGSVGYSILKINAYNSCGNNLRDVIFYIPSSYRISPVPAQDNLVVTFSDVDEEFLLPDQLDIVSEKELKSVKTINVKEVFKNKKFKNKNEVHFNVSDLASGTYYLRVLNSKQSLDKQVETTRFLIE